MTEGGSTTGSIWLRAGWKCAATSHHHHPPLPNHLPAQQAQQGWEWFTHLGRTTTTQNQVKKERCYLQVNTPIPGLLEMLHRDKKQGSPKSLALQNRLCFYPSHPQPPQHWRIPEKSDPALPLPTAAAKASPWKLAA